MVRESSLITAVKKDKSGAVTHFMMSNGQIYDYATIMRMAEIGQLDNVRVKEENGQKTVKNWNQGPDSDLRDFPLFE